MQVAMATDPTATERMQVGELAERAGVSHRTVHYYERMGLIAAPERKSGGYRYYGPDALRRLRLVDRLKQLGLSLEEVRQVLPLYAEDTSGLRGKQEVVAILERHLNDTDRKLAQLSGFRDELIANLARFRTWIDGKQAIGGTPTAD
jgi:MerR family copper efflux transcriptional regulator